MKVETIISLNCWCGEKDVKTYKKGDWHSNSKSPRSFVLGKCVKCNMVRTVSVSGETSIDYDNTTLYSDLSLRHRNSLKTLNRYINENKILEIGCNEGMVMEYINANFKIKSIEGSDFNAKAIEIANKKGLKVSERSLKDFSEKFDLVFAMHVFEHVFNLNELFDDIKNVVNNGILYFSVPNIKSFNAFRNLKGWGALNPHEHIWHFDTSSIKKLIKFVLPNSKIIKIRTSNVWKLPGPFSILNKLFGGDQIEVVIRVNE